MPQTRPDGTAFRGGRRDLNTRLAASLALAIGTMLLLSALLELRSTRRELTAALDEQGRTVMALAQRGLESALLSYRHVEGLLEQKLLDNARLLERLDREGRLTGPSLQAIAAENTLLRINVFDAAGVRQLTSAPGGGAPPIGAPRRLLQPILSDSTEELIIGFRQQRYGLGQNYAVARRRSRGGAIVVNADAGQLLEFRRAIGAGSFIRLVGESENVHYAVVQDSTGILLASAGVTEMSAPDQDAFINQAMAAAAKAVEGSLPRTRFTIWGGDEIFEIVAPAAVEGSDQALLRIGLPAVSLHHAVRAALWRIGLSTLLLIATALLAGAALIHDARERQRMEEQLARQEKLTAMGHLASGVAHEIRNPLNAVSMIAQRLQREFEPRADGSEYRELTTTLASESRRINAIITQFLQFARPAPLNKTPLRLDQLVGHVAALLQGEAGQRGITISQECRQVREISADGDKLTQALLNLVRNSIAACSPGGRIALSCRQLGEEIAVEVQDNGAGIAPEELDKIFNLYYTTREEGSGLGLSIVQQIVTQHGGKIQVASQPGQGTRFTITLHA